jgi:subtilase family serine protease
MTRRSRAVGALIAACALGAPAAAAADATTPAATTQLAGSAAPATTTATAVGAVAPSQKLHVELWLTPDISGATRFDDAVSAPGNILYHQYLTPEQYTAEYGPSAAEAQAVSSWLSSAGFSHVQIGAERDAVTATGSAVTVDEAFSVQMNRYRVTSAAGRTSTIVANDQDLSLPSALSDDVLSVTGLNGTPATTFHSASLASATKSTAPKAGSCSQYWDQYTKTLKPAFAGVTQAAVSVCGYSADQLRAAYGQTSANTGAGQTIALIEDGTPDDMFGTLTDYATTNGLPAPKSTQFREEVIGRGNACGNPFDIEEQLDSEASYAMAPGANQLMVDGDSCGEKLEGVQPLFDAEEAVLDGNGNSAAASIESNSWGITGGESFPPIYAKTAHSIDLRATAEGVGMYFSSGDSPGVSVPASDPYSLAVGGTTVGIGATGNRIFETGWSNHDGVLVGKKWVNQGIPRDAAGGGVSILYKQPSYQAGVVPASMATYQGQLDRALPDISADADPNSGILQGIIVGKQGKYETFVDGGTSLATPLVAGIVADAQQGQAASFGFINPLIYSLYGTSALNDTLPVTASTPAVDSAGFATPKISIYGEPSVSIFDSQIPKYTSQVTTPGYDTMTGVGTPNGTAFINGLRSGS